MKKSRYTDSQIMDAMKRAGAGSPVRQRFGYCLVYHNNIVSFFPKLKGSEATERGNVPMLYKTHHL